MEDAMETRGAQGLQAVLTEVVSGVKALGPDQPERDPVTSSLATDPQGDKGPVSETRTAGDPTARLCPFLSAFKVR